VAVPSRKTGLSLSSSQLLGHVGTNGVLLEVLLGVFHTTL